MNNEISAMEDQEALERFNVKIEAEEKIEPKDWMPQAYRKNLVRLCAGKA